MSILKYRTYSSNIQSRRDGTLLTGCFNFRITEQYTHRQSHAVTIHEYDKMPSLRDFEEQVLRLLFRILKYTVNRMPSLRDFVLRKNNVKLDTKYLKNDMNFGTKYLKNNINFDTNYLKNYSIFAPNF